MNEGVLLLMNDKVLVKNMSWRKLHELPIQLTENSLRIRNPAFGFEQRLPIFCHVRLHSPGSKRNTEDNTNTKTSEYSWII